MLRRLGQRFEAFFRATTPDPFVLAVGLTLVVFVLAAVLRGQGPLEIVRSWQGDSGFFGLLAFTMQMVLILVTGHALAATPPVQALIARVAALPRTGPMAAAMVAGISIGCGLLNWGLGLIVGALLAREVGASCARRRVDVHYPLLVAAGYSPMMCWHGGLSGTAPLTMTTETDVRAMVGEELAARVEPVPFTETVFGIENLVVTGGLWVLVPMLCVLLAPKSGEGVGIDAYVKAPDALPAPSGDRALRYGAAALAAFGILVFALRGSLAGAIDTKSVIVAVSLAVTAAAVMLGREGREPAATVPERLERSPWVMALIGAPLVAGVLLWFDEVGVQALDPNAINLIFLTAGLLLSGSLARYASSVGEATSGAAGIVLQFPFYAGIMGVMRTSGLAEQMATWVAENAPRELYTTVTFLMAGMVNLFVPSGGGQWAVQGPIAVEAARGLGVPLEQAIMAVAYGDQWTNMLQPFWALPLLAITGIKARDIMGYTALFLIAGGLWISGCLFAFSVL